MRSTYFIIPSLLIFQFAGAQNGATSITEPQGTATAPVSTVSSNPVMSADAAAAPVSPTTTQTAILDYKGVFEAATLEEEVKMATERFTLTPAQQDIWLSAATDRRQAEKVAREKLDSKAANYEREGIYRGLRSAQNTFHETIVGYLSPAQKQALEADRMIMEEKRKKMAKLPPPPPPAPTVTVAPVDSSAIKTKEKGKGTSKKSKKKKKAIG
jgi:hypothetical protein